MIISTLLKTNNVKKGSLVNVSPLAALYCQRREKRSGSGSSSSSDLMFRENKKKILTIKHKSVPLGKVLEEQSKAQHSYLSV